MIAARGDCDVYRIEAADAYPEDYDATVARNVREQDVDARPAIADALPALNAYDVVLLASPGATVAEGLAIRGEGVVDAGDTVNRWLQRSGLTTE